MFGLFVGMVTEYATGAPNSFRAILPCVWHRRWEPSGQPLNTRCVLAGVDFPNQLKLTVSVLGIADVYD